MLTHTHSENDMYKENMYLGKLPKRKCRVLPWMGNDTVASRAILLASSPVLPWGCGRQLQR